MKRLAISIAVMLIALCALALGTSATELNNGSKIILKEGTDSLFSTYQYYQFVMYGYSEGGTTWYGGLVDMIEHDHPTIAADSTGRRWIVARCPVIFPGFPVAQQAYYWDGSEWHGPQAVYSIYPDTGDLGPASIDGAAFTSTSWAYAAFCDREYEGGSNQYIVLTKFNGSTVAACTLMTADTLGDPAIAVEPYKADSNRVHVTWEDGGTIRYAVGLDCRTSSSIGYMAVGGSLASDTAYHPSINADRDRVVVAWAQGSPPDIYARQRLSGTWEDAVELSDSEYASDWPTIALGDAVVVAWDEAISAGDHDIHACIDLDPDDTEYIADGVTVSSYPHIVLEPDGEDLYLHTLWSEPNYAVGHDKRELVGGGEGQLSAGSAPIAPKPSLAACEPNPVRGHARISYALPAAGNVSLGVYDATGRTVRTLASGHQKVGSYSVTWDSKDNRGRQVPRGVYFYRFDTPGYRSVKKAVVTR